MAGMMKKLADRMNVKNFRERMNQRRERRRNPSNIGQPMPGRGGKDRRTQPIDKGPIYGAR